MVGEEENCHYNVQLVSVIYNNELKEHLDELGELKNTLAEDGKAYSDTTRWINKSHLTKHIMTIFFEIP